MAFRLGRVSLAAGMTAASLWSFAPRLRVDGAVMELWLWARTWMGGGVDRARWEERWDGRLAWGWVSTFDWETTGGWCTKGVSETGPVAGGCAEGRKGKAGWMAGWMAGCKVGYWSMT